LIAYINGWLNLTGNWLILLSINFGGAQLIMSAPALWIPDYAAKNWQILLVFVAVMIGCALVNLLPNGFLNQLNKACMYWTGASVLIILITLLAMADTRRSGAFVFGDFENASGYPDGWAWFVGLLQYVAPFLGRCCLSLKGRRMSVRSPFLARCC
jgi:amino acid transporter